MRFDRIEITNFRSFGPETTTIPFPPDENLVTIVGANNAGKSNLIEALRLVLGEIRRPDLTEADFHGLDYSRELRIDLVLREPLRREAIVRSKVEEIQGFRFRGHQLERGQSIGELKVDHQCLTPSLEVFRPIPFVGRSADRDDVTKRPALLMARPGFEPGTPRFSVVCSTN
jgi:putative ATP-dependent endonuclease of OLD family